MLAAAVVVLLAGCGTFSTMTDLAGRLEDDGFRNVRVNFDQRNLGVLVVRADAPSGSSTEEGQEAAAKVVWDTFPRRVDAVRITIDGDGRGWTYAEMEEAFGERPDRLDRTALDDDLTRLAVTSVVGALAVGVVVLVLVGVTILLVARSRRRGRVVGQPVQPWMPPDHRPVPPDGGWVPAGSAPPSGVSLAKQGEDTGNADADTSSGTGTSTGTSSGTGTTTPPTFAPPPVPSAWTGLDDGAAGRSPEPRERGRRRDPDARRLGRRPPGRRPDAAHTPPGWD